MILWSFDMGVNLGVAMGDTKAAPPVSRVLRLKGQAGCALMKFLAAEFKRQKPDLVFKEQALEPAAMARIGMSGQSAKTTLGLHYVIESMCVWYDVPLREAKDQTIRKHFIGVGKLGSRDATNRRIVLRCHMLGYMPRDDANWDRANACSGWDYAAHVYGRASADALALFGEESS